MARKERITEPGFYHIINRGVERRNIYLESDDYDFFISLLQKLSKDFDIIIHSFCLMTNHYHILLETKHTNISKAIQFLNDKYSKYFNKKYNRSGHLWQGRFASYYLYDDTHFWYVTKYIERNPIKAGLIKQIDSYKYQSFFQWKFRSKYFELLTNSKIHDMTLNEYEEFISSDIQEDVIEKVYQSPKYITKDGKMKILYKRLETFFEEDRDINRNMNIQRAYEYGYKKADIANFLNLNHSSISRIVK